MNTNTFRILALDDDPSILLLYRRILSGGPNGNQIPSGILFDMACCTRPEDAVETVRRALVENQPFSMAFLDIHMPEGRDGVWAVEKIRKLDPDMGIIMVTGYTETDIEVMERRVPPSSKLFYLEKPVKTKEILRFSLALSARWAAEREVRRMHDHLETMVAERTAALVAANERLTAEVENRLKTEKALRLSQENFRSMIVENADGILIFDQEQIVRFANPAAEGIFQKKAEKIIGTLLGYPLVNGDRTELDIVQSKGDPVVAEMRVTQTRWEGKSAYLASIRDISEHSRTRKTLRQSLDVLEHTMVRTVEAMAKTVERKDPYTAGHQYRVALLSQAIGQEMELSDQEILGLYMAAVVHDIGKICVPAEILSKPGRLNKPEMDMIRRHPQDGYDILKDIAFPWPIARIVMQHHERMDGSGYPRGLSGEEIMMPARILAVADVVEAMASHRPYRASLGLPLALEEIAKNSGKFYDRQVANICLRLFKEKRFTLPTSQHRRTI